MHTRVGHHPPGHRGGPLAKSAFPSTSKGKNHGQGTGKAGILQPIKFNPLQPAVWLLVYNGAICSELTGPSITGKGGGAQAGSWGTVAAWGPQSCWRLVLRVGRRLASWLQCSAVREPRGSLGVRTYPVPFALGRTLRSSQYSPDKLTPARPPPAQL